MYSKKFVAKMHTFNMVFVFLMPTTVLYRLKCKRVRPVRPGLTSLDSNFFRPALSGSKSLSSRYLLHYTCTPNNFFAQGKGILCKHFCNKTLPFICNVFACFLFELFIYNKVACLYFHSLPGCPFKSIRYLF